LDFSRKEIKRRPKQTSFFLKKEVPNGYQTNPAQTTAAGELKLVKANW